MDDFILNPPRLADTTSTAYTPAIARALGTMGNWTAGGATANSHTATVTPTSTDKNGLIVVSATDDNTDLILAWPPSAEFAGPFDFSSGNKIWMEARLKMSTITDAKLGLFVGFAEEGLLNTTELLSATDSALSDKDYVGFWKSEADGDAITTLWNTVSGSGSPNTAYSTVVPVADTFIKLGIKFDGTTIRYYANGDLLGYSVACSATPFPDGEEMAFYIAGMLGSNDTTTWTIDWVRLAQQNTGC